MFSLLPWERTLVAASHVAPTVVLPQGPQGWGSAYTLFPNRSAEMTDGSEKRKHQLTFELQSSRVFKKPTPMRSPLSQKVTWPAATRVLSRGKREPWERHYRIIKFLRRSRYVCVSHIHIPDVYWYKEHTIYLNSGSFLASSISYAVFVFKGAVSRNSAKLGN